MSALRSPRCGPERLVEVRHGQARARPLCDSSALQLRGLLPGDLELIDAAHFVCVFVSLVPSAVNTARSQLTFRVRRRAAGRDGRRRGGLGLGALLGGLDAPAQRVGQVDDLGLGRLRATSRPRGPPAWPRSAAPAPRGSGRGTRSDRTACAAARSGWRPSPAPARSPWPAEVDSGLRRAPHRRSRASPA